MVNPPVGTRDIDTIIPRNLPKVSSKTIYQHLLEAGFTHSFKNLDEPPVESYMKKINGVEAEIEFLTHASVRINPYMNTSIAGVVAQPLSYLTMSLESTRSFTISTGGQGYVVSPAAWIFHKGLTFPRRKMPFKQLKDLYGIWYVASQLESFSTESLLELKELRRTHRKWSETFQQNLRQWLGQAAPRDWANLEAQDPNGNLIRERFLELIESQLLD